MADTKFDICSEALVMVGAEPIASFDDGTAESDAARVTYEPVLKAALALPGGRPYRWRFASDLRELAAPVAGTPTAKFDHAYNLPDDMIELTGVYKNDRPIPYQRFANKVLCDEPDGIVVEITIRPLEANFPPSFRVALVKDLGSRFAMGLAQDPTEAGRLAQEAKLYWAGARSIDSQQQPPRPIRATRLVTAGMSGSSSRGE